MHQPVLSQLTKKERRHLCSLAKAFLRTLEKAFSAVPFRVAIEPTPYLGGMQDIPVVRLASPNPDVPELRCALYDDEITLYWGPDFHMHICGDSLWRRKGTSQEEAERKTVEMTLEYIRGILSDRIALRIHLRDGKASSGQMYSPENSKPFVAKGGSEFVEYVWSQVSARSEGVPARP